MTGAPSSTWFSAPPHWEWLIVLYFFLGGLAGGSYFISALIDLFGRREDRPLAHLGYYVTFPCLVISGILLAVDLGRPLRAWHMFVESNTWRPMFKPWSPMSLGSWALLLFGAVSFLSFLATLADAGRLRWRGVARLRPPGMLGCLVSVVGGLLGFFVAGYTGVLLSVTNRPIWAGFLIFRLDVRMNSITGAASGKGGKPGHPDPPPFAGIPGNLAARGFSPRDGPPLATISICLMES